MCRGQGAGSGDGPRLKAGVTLGGWGGNGGPGEGSDAPEAGPGKMQSGLMLPYKSKKPRAGIARG